MPIPLRHRRGLAANLPGTAGVGELLAALDVGHLYMGQGANKPLLPLPIYSSEYVIEESANVRTLRTTAMTDLQTLSVTNMPAGVYVIETCALWSLDDLNSDAQFDVLVNGNQLMPAVLRWGVKNSNQVLSANLKRHVQLAAGSHLIRLRSARTELILGGPTLSIKYTSIQLMRVG